jgi:uncharacterized repeat protein (TIGR03803 family)
MNEQISSAGCNPLHRRDQKLRRGKRRITGKLNWAKSIVFFLLCATTAIALPAQTLTTLHSFDGTDGADSSAVLVQATDGNLYGTTRLGGANGAGTVFKITPSGTLTTLHNFCSGGAACVDGDAPYAGLVQAADGNFYGTTLSGGTYGAGTVFKITPSGTLTTLYSFCSESPCTGGFGLVAGLVQATDGNFYGTTAFGGSNGSGTVFKITPSGTLTTLHNFCSGGAACVDGDAPYAGLVQATDGNFYGTTVVGGALNWGTVFKITPDGTLTTLYSFCSESGCADGTTPSAGLVQATDGNFYGTTTGGGANQVGTVFKITPSGTLTTLHSLDIMDDNYTQAALIQATDGNLYGTMRFDASDTTPGTVFKITLGGTLTTLYRFCSQNAGCPDGRQPWAGLVQDTNGKFYGTTFYGGTNNLGTIFSLDVGVGPPTNKDQCKDGGWKTFTTPRKFKNQGDCVSFVNTGK